MGSARLMDSEASMPLSCGFWLHITLTHLTGFLHNSLPRRGASLNVVYPENSHVPVKASLRVPCRLCPLPFHPWVAAAVWLVSSHVISSWQLYLRPEEVLPRASLSFLFFRTSDAGTSRPQGGCPAPRAYGTGEERALPPPDSCGCHPAWRGHLEWAPPLGADTIISTASVTKASP